MIKNKLDYKLINFAILALTIFLLYQMADFLINVLSNIWNIIKPFVIAFILAYALHPILKFLEKKKFPKALAIVLIMLSLLSIVTVILILVIPLLMTQLSSLFNNIILFFKTIPVNNDFGPLQDTLISSANSIILSLSNYVSSGAINIINLSLGVVMTIVIAFAVSIYFLIEMDKIRKSFKVFLNKRSRKAYLFFTNLDKQMKAYLLGVMTIVVITFFEYNIAYHLVGHPNALLLGTLAAFGNLVPFFGLFLVGTTAIITAAVSVPFPALLIKTIIAILFISVMDTYVINPNIFKKSNKVHPIAIIFSVFAGGYLFGFMGILFALPITIVLINLYKFYAIEIHGKISDFKKWESKK